MSYSIKDPGYQPNYPVGSWDPAVLLKLVLLATIVSACWTLGRK